nr:hypothetical protein [Tanacetum cinerariifolium]
MQKKKNDVKARTTLLLSLPDEHQLRFSKYKTARELWAAILKTFGGNGYSRKRQKQGQKQQNQTPNGKDQKRQSHSKPKVKVKARGATIAKSQQNFTLVVGNKMHKAFSLPAIKFPLAEEVPTASVEGCHCQKKSEATARKIALLC